MKNIFLSHSTQDQPLAYALYLLFNRFIIENKMDHEVHIFYSPIDLKDNELYSQNWREGLKSAMKESSKVVTLWTPNSIENRWVNYEVGLASALNKQIIPVGVKGIEFNLIITNHIQIISLSEFSNFFNILSKTFDIDKDRIAEWATEKGKYAINNVIDKASPKCVYFVGSKQKKDSHWNDKEVELFVKELSDNLLNTGFRLASFPSVPHVGKVVASCALAKGKDKYEIAGLYKFDEKAKQIIADGDIDPGNWNKTIEKFREIYLKNKDCIIIIGGGKNTRNEYDVALKDRNRQIFPIPCFGGFAGEQFNKLNRNPEYRTKYRHPCSFCDKKRDEYGHCPHIQDFVKRMNEHIAIPND